jgi:hypothetical protein
VIGGKVTLDLHGFQFIVTENKRRDVTLKGARAGMAVVQKEARTRAPKRVGALKKAQGILAKKGKRGLTTSYAVQGSRRKYELMATPPGRAKPMRIVPAFYDHLVQGGTRPHSVSRGQSLGREQRYSKAGVKFGKHVKATNQGGNQHPGTSAHPFRKFAWLAAKDRIADAALRAMAEAERKIMNQAARKAFKGI